MGWEIRTPSAWPWSVQEIEQSFTRAARDDHSATRGSQDRHQTKRSTVGPKRRKLSDQLSEKAERSAVGSHLREGDGASSVTFSTAELRGELFHLAIGEDPDQGDAQLGERIPGMSP